MLADVARDGACVCVVASARRLADDEANGFVFVKVLSESRLGIREQQVQAERNPNEGEGT